jgi:short-subunit dehydrogenase
VRKRGRTVVITGASDGIGAAAARLLASDEVRLVLVGRSPIKTKAVAEQVGAEYHVCDRAGPPGASGVWGIESRWITFIEMVRGM